jgi:prepilin-type processing-associated H-X9-DG protein
MWNSFSAQALMLNYLEQTAIYNALNFNSSPGPGLAKNSTGVERVIAAFLCPSDSNSGGGHQNFNNYAASFGATTDNMYNWDNVRYAATNSHGPHGSSGMFTFAMAYGLRDCTDGSSGTVAYAEWLVGDGQGSNYGGKNPPSKYRGNMIIGAPQATPAFHSAFQNSAAVLLALQQCADAFKTMTTGIADIKGLRWANGASGFTMFNTILTPNDSQFRYGGCRMDGSPPNNWPDNSFVIGAASAHPGGANTLFADGSVKFIKDSISRNIWWSLGTRDGGEVVSSDSY